MEIKSIFVLGTMLLIGLMLVGCAGYSDGGYGYYEYPYYNYGYGYNGYPNYHGHEWGESSHREMGVAPHFEEHHAPASGHTEQTHPMNGTSTPRTPARGNEEHHP